MTSLSGKAEAAHLRAASFAPAARDWLETTQSAHVLHVFEKACNLVNEAGDVLSFVQHRLGDGPFAVRLQDGPLIDFTQWIAIGTTLDVSSHLVQAGDLHIELAGATLWHPVPDWTWLNAHQNDWIPQLPSITHTLLAHAPPGSLAYYFADPASDTELPTLQQGVLSMARPLIADLVSGIHADDRDRYMTAASRLAGLGGGLTPAGDDFLLGVLYALWANQPDRIDTVGPHLVETAVPRTTRLSGAWLKAGLRGEAGSLWHRFVNALKSGDQTGLVKIVAAISGVGHTSGSDALAGFVAILHN